MPKSDVLLEVWREACRHLELEESIGRIARMIAPDTAGDALVVRQVDVARSGLETIAIGQCREGAEPISSARTECAGLAMRELTTWCQTGQLIGGSVSRVGGVVATVVPPGFQGDCIAAPLHVDDGPTGVVLLLAARTRLTADDRALMTRLMEPITVALANTARVHELKRLREALEADKQALLSKLGRHDVVDAVVGEDTGLRAVMNQVDQVAATDVPVLIIGETGSGKEVLARTLHQRSRRARAPIVRVNCGAIPPGLVDSELFGHERGSFTGAVATRQGWFERADGGTLFLDEVGELPLEAQVRLLRILQDGTFERVGGQRPLSVDVRIVAATHRDLREMVTQGAFREDLWYRVSVFPIRLPPLRERREDIPRLATHFAWRAGTRLVGVPLTPRPEDIECLLDYEWPGNVRELAAVIERAAILGGGRQLQIGAALGPAARVPSGRVAALESGSGASAPGSPSPSRAPADPRASGPAPAVDPSASMDEAMRRHIIRALEICGGRVEGPHGVARRLGINPHTLRARMRKLGIAWQRFRHQISHPDAASTDATDTPLATLDDAMRAHLGRVLEITRGRVEGPRGAAVRLRINPHTLRARLRKLRMEVAPFRRA